MGEGDIRRVVIATDLTAASVDLYAHGLALVLRARAESTVHSVQLYLVHVDDGQHPEQSWRRLPTVRTLLERWGRAVPGELEQLGIEVHRVEAHPTDGDLPVAVARRVAELKPDLLLLGTHPRSGFERMFAPSVSEPVARDVHRATLFVSDQARGFVDLETGDLRIRRVIVPIGDGVPQQPVVDELARLLEALGVADVGFTFVHAGSETVPIPTLPERTDWRWNTDLRKGGVVEQILEAEIAHDADLIAMATRGRDSFLDSLRGSTAERVVRRARCPVLTVPV